MFYQLTVWNAYNFAAELGDSFLITTRMKFILCSLENGITKSFVILLRGIISSVNSPTRILWTLLRYLWTIHHFCVTCVTLKRLNFYPITQQMRLILFFMIKNVFITTYKNLQTKHYFTDWKKNHYKYHTLFVIFWTFSKQRSEQKFAKCAVKRKVLHIWTETVFLFWFITSLYSIDLKK